MARFHGFLRQLKAFICLNRLRTCVYRSGCLVAVSVLLFCVVFVRQKKENRQWTEKIRYLTGSVAERYVHYYQRARNQTEVSNMYLTLTTQTERNLSFSLSVTDIDLEEQRLRHVQRLINPGDFRIISRDSQANDSHLRYRDLAAVQAERQARLHHVCQDRQLRAPGREPRTGSAPLYHEGWNDLRVVYGIMEAYMPHNLLFCPVLKVGSTFFRRLFFALSQELTISSPYDIPIKTALKSRRSLWQTAQRGKWERKQLPFLGLHGVHLVENFGDKRKQVQSLVSGLGKVMFTREPYSKLLSGFVDKLFAPNPFFWNAIGRVIIRKFRENPKLKSLECGHDVKFSEFIKFVIENERSNKLKRDAHFEPTFDQCKPCRFSYDIIGKMETFQTDVSLLLAQLGHNLSQSTFNTWTLQGEHDAIRDSVYSPSMWQKAIVNCIGLDEAKRRIWRKLQIRGILDRHESLPTSNTDANTFKAEAFVGTVQKSWSHFRETGLKVRQRKEALSSAYSTVSQKDLRLLREYFLLDFDLFGYNSMPDHVFMADNVWDVFNATVFVVEVGAREFVGSSAYDIMKQLFISGKSRTSTLKAMAEAAEKSSS